MVPGHPDWTVIPFPPPAFAGAHTADELAALAAEHQLDEPGLVHHGSGPTPRSS